MDKIDIILELIKNLRENMKKSNANQNFKNGYDAALQRLAKDLKKG